MVGRKKRSPRKRELLGSHQRSWVWGRNPVLEILRGRNWVPLEIVVSDELDADTLEETSAIADELGIALTSEPRERLTRRCQTREHQGLLAKMPPFMYLPIEEILETATQPGLFIVLDSIQDPFNFGAVCRTACAFGADGILLSSQNQVGVTSQVVRSSAGAVTRLKIARVDALPAEIKSLAERNIQTVATAADADLTIAECDFQQPTAIVFGNEGVGLTPAVRDACSLTARIPQSAEFDSLNAAVATGILLYEIRRQRASRL
jgi:23S rRNA (guanosine2251-2'-O)-methyltransferase